MHTEQIAPPPISPLVPPAQPDWLQVMSDSEVEISSELHWSCVAAGKPRPSIRWLRNGQPLSTQVQYIGHHRWVSYRVYRHC